MLGVERTLGAGADGRKFAAAEFPKRSLIVDGTALVNGRYEPQSAAQGTVYIQTDSVSAIPTPESRLTLWRGTQFERVVHVESYSRYFDPQIGDVLEIRIK